MKKLTVNAGKGYNILIEKGIMDCCGQYISEICQAKKVCLISDDNVFSIYGNKVKSSLENQGFKVYEFVFKAGESSKTTATVISMVEFMAEKQLVRSDIVVALGGGVCGDMAGFAASIYLRGIDFVQIPTSLLAQVDSSVGGKTAVDLPQGKNLCGAFHQPILVLIDPNTLDTLPSHYFSDGLAEAIKMGCIKSLSLFEKIEQNDAHEIIEDIIYECDELKAQVVERDEKEHGERALLNFGHTPGHAIEKLHGFTTVSHGEAVGIGMVMISKAGEMNNITEKGTSERIANVLKKYGLRISDSHSINEIIGAMSADKKRTSNAINFTLIKKIGDSFNQKIEYDKIPDFFGA